MTFQDCNLMEPIIRALTEQGYTEPTAIQAEAIVPALAGRDILGTARTGTGKTCAFATPILQRLHQRKVEGRPIRALILTPTRELAIQNQDCFEAYGKYLPLKSAVIFGGVGQQPQVDAIQAGVDILVATPGRLADLYQQGYLDLSHLEIFVLDEADRMLDMGFIHDVKKILKWLPAKKQTLFFSATMPPELHDLVEGLLHNPVHVSVDPVNTTVDAIDQSLYRVDKGNKTSLLVQLLQENHWPSVLVFTRTKHGANKVSRDLERAGITSAAIHGNKSQTARQAALAGFKAGEIRVLVATDLAARGLDIEDLSCVVNYNLPDVPETYVHRIGRTGRAGKDGRAISFCSFDEGEMLKDIEKLTRQRIPVVENHPFPMQQTEPSPRDKNGRIVNADDQEAREVARAKAKERREAERQRQAEQAKEQAGQEAAPQQPKKKRKKKSPKPEETAAETAPVTAAPVPEEPKGEPSGKRKKKSPKPEEAAAEAAPVTAAPVTGEPKAEPSGKRKKKGGKSKAQTPQTEEEYIPSLSVSEFFGVDIPDLLPPREEAPPVLEEKFDSSDILHRKPKKPERRVVPSLSSVSLLPAFELKETFGPKLREDSQTFRLDGALDATDRMFRTGTAPSSQPEKPESAGKAAAPKKGKKKKSAGQSAPAQNPPKQAAPQKEESAQPARKKKGKNPQSAAPAESRPARNPDQKEKQGGQGHKKGKKDKQSAPVSTGVQKNVQKRKKSRVPSVELRPSRVKDSTEQESLMKPYYLSDVEHKK